MSLEPYSVMILDMAKRGLSSAEISARISHESGGARGCSARNVRRFCAENGLSLMGLPNAHLELEAPKAITEVGPTNGRRMIKGYLTMKGVHASETRIGTVLRTMHQSYHEARRQNHIVERIWPEVNSRVNNPLKTALLQLVAQEEIDMNDSLVRYSVKPDWPVVPDWSYKAGGVMECSLKSR